MRPEKQVNVRLYTFLKYELLRTQNAVTVEISAIHMQL